MRRHTSIGCAVVAMFCLLSTTVAFAQGRHGNRQGNEHGNPHGNPQESQQQGHQAEQAAQQQAQNAQREQQRSAQQQGRQAEQAAQQQAHNAQREQQRNAQQEGRRNELAAQQQAQNAQREQQRNAQQQGRQNAENAQREQQRNAQQQSRRNEQAAQQNAENAQREQQRNAQQQSRRNEQAAQQQTQNAQREQQRNAQQQGYRNGQAAQRHAENAQRAQQRSVQGLGRRMDRFTSPIRTANFDQTIRRPSTRRPHTFRNVPLQNAFPMPNFVGRAAAAQRAQARIAEQNMRAHLIAVPMSLAPSNYARLRNAQLNTYYNNYPFSVGNQQYYINRQNTRYNSVRPSNYPSWYQPNSNWVFSNGFTLGNAINIGLSWLGFGWQPYYGASPVGFICARDYMPTPWMYQSASGQWRQPGLYTYASDGPDDDYTGPITIEVIEQVTDRRGNTNNVLYLYNAFYYPDVERWGYENRQGYFIWLDEDARLS